MGNRADLAEVDIRMGNRADLAEVDIWNYVFGFVKMAVAKCVIELGVADAIENHGSPMTLSDLSKAVGCEPSRLHRILRFLVHCQVLKEEPLNIGEKYSIAYAHTPISRCFVKRSENSMAALIMLEFSPAMLAPWHSLSGRVISGTVHSPFNAAHGMDVWSYAEANPGDRKLIDEAMACGARRAVPAMIEGCPQVFDGIGSLVDVGGGHGTALSMIVKAFPWIHGINFDLPHVVAKAGQFDGITNVGGDMFGCIPKADAAFFMWVLHDWDDKDCIKILKKCREAIPKDKGKVLIVEAVLEEDKNDELDFVRLALDMVMMAQSNNGKERTFKEWSYVLGEAGFTRFNIKTIRAVQSVIEAYP